MLLVLAALAAPAVTRSELPDALRGLSGLAVDADGRLWSVAERDVALVPLALDGDRVVSAGRAIPVGGWPVGLDAESLAWLGPGRFLVGTESLVDGRRADRLVEVRVTDGRAEVVASRALPYGPFGLAGASNRGIEALDAADGRIVAASEVVSAGPRAAPLWRLPVEGGAPEYAALLLTSAEGKLSSLTLVGEELWAIERHYATVRLIAATPVWGAAPVPVSARVVRDLAAELGALPNLEGLARLPDGRVVLLSDNQGGLRVEGPTVALVLAAE